MSGSSYVYAGQRVTAAALDSSYASSDSTPFSVAATGLTQIVNSYTIPAGEPAVGSVYRLRATGSGTQGSTAQNLTLAGEFGGLTTGMGLTFGSAFAAVNAAFHWQAELEALCLSTGSGGTWQVSLTASCGSGTSTTLTGVAQNSSALSVSTAAAIAVTIEAGWASTTGSPTASGLRSVFVRVL